MFPASAAHCRLEVGEVAARLEELRQGALGARHPWVAEAAPSQVVASRFEIGTPLQPLIQVANCLELSERSLEELLGLGSGSRAQQAQHHAVARREA